MSEDKDELFLPYQKRWLNDKSRYKLSRKSRRTGFTWVQAFEDVKDASTLKIKGRHCDVWFSSADNSAGIEYIRYCADWAKAINISFKDIGEKIIDENYGIKAHSLEFESGARITALSSNPRAFRSKGGKVVLDEFAFHDNPAELWKAAKPVITWGYPLRIISSLNGTNNLFYKFTQLIEKGKLNWSMHDIPIQLAVKEGLVDKILGYRATEKEIQDWLSNEKEGCADKETWLQEYCCIAVDENSAFLSFELINSADCETLTDNLDSIKGDLYIGFDVARHKDLSVISIFEKLGCVFYLRKIIELEKVLFRNQKTVLYTLLRHPKTRRCCIDSTGIGAQLAEDASIDFKHIAEALTFTNKSKEELAFGLLYAFQDNNLRFPCEEKIVNDLHSLKKLKTTTGAIRFDSDRSETDGHADRFWSFALAIYAGTSKPYVKPVVKSAKRNINKGLGLELNLRGLGGFLRGINF